MRRDRCAMLQCILADCRMQVCSTSHVLVHELEEGLIGHSAQRGDFVTPLPLVVSWHKTAEVADVHL
jgi:hypothetical protein